MTEDQFHIIACEDFFFQIIFFGGYFETSGQMTEKLRNAFTSIYEEKSYFKG